MTSPGSDVDVSDLDDVQRLYIILEPQQPAGGKCRLLVVAKKRLPDTKKHERFLAFVGRCRPSVPSNAGSILQRGVTMARPASTGPPRNILHESLGWGLLHRACTTCDCRLANVMLGVLIGRSSVEMWHPVCGTRC